MGNGGRMAHWTSPLSVLETDRVNEVGGGYLSWSTFRWDPSPDHLDQLEEWLTDASEHTRLILQEGKATFLNRVEDESALPFMLSILSSESTNQIDILSHTMKVSTTSWQYCTTQIWNDDWFEEDGYDEQIAPIITSTRTLLSPYIERSDDEVFAGGTVHTGFGTDSQWTGRIRSCRHHFALVFKTEQSDWADDDTRIPVTTKWLAFNRNWRNWTGQPISKPSCS